MSSPRPALTVRGARLSMLSATSAREEAATTMLFRTGRESKILEALEHKREAGTIRIEPGDRYAAAQRVAALWRERVEANAHQPDYTVTVSAPTNAQARLVAEAIRRERRAMGRLEGPDVEFAATSRSRRTPGLARRP